MKWDDAYHADGHIWGERPSELAAFACKYLTSYDSGEEEVDILDIGCGYGRDCFFLARNLRCRVFGIDNAEEAIKMALEAPAGENLHVSFKCCDFKQITGETFDVVFVSNLYQLLVTQDRDLLRGIIRRTLKQDGKLFLSTLSIRDPEHFGKGTRVQGEENSYIEDKFLHFCSRKELERDFSFLKINELREHEYDEHRSNRKIHHHISWMLFGMKQ